MSDIATTAVKAIESVGVAPKVKAFLAAVGGPGVILLILGFILDDADLKTAGIAALGAAVVGGGAGAAAGPGKVVVAEHTADPTPALPHEGVV
jgi:hypothetical protein